MFSLQRDEDREIARLQRELDLNITNEKRKQDYDIAEKERNASEIQRNKEFIKVQENHFNDLILENDRQRENVLLEYHDDLADLFFHFGSLIKDPQSKSWFILQMKTAAALRQLDSARRTILVRTLSNMGLLDENGEKTRSIFHMANLSGVEFGQSYSTYSEYICISYDRLYLSEADLRYASFRGVCIAERAFLVPFCDLDYTDWSFSIVVNVHFDNEMTINRDQFTRTRFKGVRFNKNIQMNYVSFQYNIDCTHCTFHKTSLLGVRFDHATFISSTFESLSMADSNMTNGSLTKSSFASVTLDRIDLTGANLTDSIFSHVSMINCSLFQTQLDRVIFRDVNLTGCQGFTNQQLSVIAQISQTTLPNGTLIN